jgi:hypothetical protein
MATINNYRASTLPRMAPKVISTAPAAKSPTITSPRCMWKIWKPCSEVRPEASHIAGGSIYTAKAAATILRETLVQLCDFKKTIKNPKPMKIIIWTS